MTPTTRETALLLAEMAEAEAHVGKAAAMQRGAWALAIVADIEHAQRLLASPVLVVERRRTERPR